MGQISAINLSYGIATFCKTDAGETIKRMPFLAENEKDIYEKANKLFVDAAINGYSGIVNISLNAVQIFT